MAPLSAPVAGLVLFDGDCPFCHRAVRLLARLDRRGRLRFAPLAGETARRLGLACAAGERPDSLLFVAAASDAAGHPPFERSEAVLAALELVGWGARAAARVVRLLPRRLRDAAYDFVARRRERWFGRYPRCPSPPARLSGRFLP